MLRFAVAALAVALAATPAGAAPRVLVLGAGAAPRETFVDALRIQLRDAAAVELGPDVGEGPLATRVANASAAAERAEAVLVLWVEDGGPGMAILYVVGRAGDRALIEIAHVSGGDEGELDRALALKAREVLDAVLAAGTRPAPAPPPARLVVGPTPAGRAAARRSRALLLEQGLVANTEGRWGIAAAAGGRVGGVEAVGGLSLLTAEAVRVPSGSVTVDEWLVLVGARYLVAAGPLRIGAELGGRLRVLDAAGATGDGRRGDTRVFVGAACGALETRLRLGSRLELRAHAGAELAFRRERFTVDGIVLYDAGRLRGAAGLSLVIALP